MITTMSSMVSKIPSTTTFSSMSTGLEQYHIHFNDWFRSNWMGLVISHQKLIILPNNKKTLYQFNVFLKSTLPILLLQEHIRGMKCGERFF